jgi:type IV pilus assembly protein PilB
MTEVIFEAPPSNGTAEEVQPSIETPPSEAQVGITHPRHRGRSSAPLVEILVELGFTSRPRADAAIEESRKTATEPERILRAANAVTADQLTRAVAERLGMDFVDLSVYKPDLAAANLISAEAAKRYGAVPVGFDEGGRLLIAMADPANILALDDLRMVTGHEVRPVAASADDIASVIGRMSRFDEDVASALEDGEDEAPEVLEIRESADDAPAIRLVNSIIAQAIGEGASDVHFEPQGRDMRVRFRIDGVLFERTTIPRRIVPGVVSRIKIVANLDIAERRLPQDGRVGLQVEKRPVDVRVVTMPSVHGEGVVMRLLTKDHALLNLDSLGMRPVPFERFDRSIRQPYGAILVTGPTGSGKTTTLYSALNEVNDVGRNIITIEDPVEYQLPGITQLQVQLRSGMSFATGLRSMLRADPDVIMVGEIRDSDTARIAVEAALTGHLVLSTLHTNDAASAITRLTEMGVEPFLTASALDCVVAQRLARALCVHCKTRRVLRADYLEKVGYAVGVDLEVYEPQGCTRCAHSGYKGRLGLYEVMALSEEIRAMCVDRASSAVIRDKAVEQGMRLLRNDGLEKVRLGLTSLEEVTRVT